MRAASTCKCLIWKEGSSRGWYEIKVDSDEKSELEYLRSIDTTLHNIEYVIYVMFLFLAFVLVLLGFIAF